MELEIRPFLPEDQPRVAALNERLRAGNAGYRFPTSPVPAWLPPAPGRRLYQEHFLAVDAAGEVRGGYILKHQEFLVAGQVRSLADYQLPLSEGIIDTRFNFVGLRLLTNALGRQRLLFVLGVGASDEPLIRMLAAMRWRVATVPFFFRVVRPYRFLRNISYLRRRTGLRVACDMAAFTGLGWLALKAAGGLLAGRLPRDPDVAWSEVASFASWADDIWEAAQPAYHLIAVRNREVLQILYPRQSARFIRLLVARQGRPVGWAVLLATPMTGHKYFGNMKVGTLVDCLALPGEEPAVVAAATEALHQRSVDLMVSNQAHETWQAALKRCGWLAGPSNFLFAASPDLARLLEPWQAGVMRFHLNRGDGDGPINL